jgi:Domain of unknown function (DUF4397)
MKKMSGLWKALPLALALTAMSLTTASCNSNSGTSGQAQIRVINAIPDGPALDIDFNGSKIFTNVTYAAAQPATAPASYLSVPAGNLVVQGFATGTTTNPVPPTGTIPLKNGVQYTVVAIGLEFNESAPLLVADDNSAPIGTNVEFRVINGSNSSPTGGVDVYVVPPATQDLTNFTPQITALNNNQASTYQTLSFLSGGYAVIITANGGKSPIITQPVTANATSITTLVILDNPGGNNGMSTTPLVLNDLN